MKNWKSLLIKESFSPELIEELAEYLDKETLTSLGDFRCISKESLVEMKAIQSKVRRMATEDLLEEFKEEANEIKDDFKWLPTKRRQYIVSLNEWLETFFGEFRSFPEFENVAIGGHSEKQVVFVTGKVADLPTHQRLSAFIKAKVPPFKILDAVAIGANSGPSS
jgi:hypothetical protein